MSNPKTVLITGSRGLLGAALVETLTRAGYIARGFEGDVREVMAVQNSFTEMQPAWVVHAASLVDVGACERNPEEAYAVNVEGTKNILDAARGSDTSVIYISTASVFSGEVGNYKEGDTPEPKNVYNTTKAAAEKLVATYEKGTILRLNIVGLHPNGSRGKNFFEWLHDTIVANKDMNLFNDQFINPLSNWTIAEMVQKIIELKKPTKIIHIGSKDHLSKADIGAMLLKHFPNYSGTARFTSIDTIADGVVRPKQMWLNTELAETLLGPMPTFTDEMDTIVHRKPMQL